MVKKFLNLYKNCPKMMGSVANYTTDPKTRSDMRSLGEPQMFHKNISSIIQNTSSIENNMDALVKCEIEIAAVISKPCYEISKEEAMDYVEGYFLASDLTCFRF